MYPAMKSKEKRDARVKMFDHAVDDDFGPMLMFDTDYKSRLNQDRAIKGTNECNCWLHDKKCVSSKQQISVCVPINHSKFGNYDRSF